MKSLCKHSILELLPDRKNVLRCQHCHLTIKADELGESYCPECYEVNGNKQFDFEEVAAENTTRTKYRCEDCGLIIEID